MRLGQFGGMDLAKAWATDVDVVGTLRLLAASGDYVYTQGASEQTVSKRTRASGEVLWTRDFLTDDGAYANIAVDAAGNVYTLAANDLHQYDADGDLVYTHEGAGAGGTGSYLAGISPDGTRIAVVVSTALHWFVNVYEPGDENIICSFRPTHGTYGDNGEITDLAFDSDNNIAVIGRYGAGPGYSYFAHKFTDLGAQVWIASTMACDGAGGGIAFDVDGNVWVIRHTTFYPLKLGKNTGAVLLTGATAYEHTVAINALSNGDLVLVQHTGTTMTLTRINSLAAEQAEEAYTDVTAVYTRYGKRAVVA